MAVMDVNNKSHPLSPLCQIWLQKIKLAKKQRHERFGQWALEAKKFFDGAHNFMWAEESSRGRDGFLSKGTSLPTFRMSVNRLAECVALYGPALYYQNPNVLVSTLETPEYSPQSLGFDPQDQMGMQQYQMMMQQQSSQGEVIKTHASIMQAYSNRIQYKTDKKSHSRRGITEAIISGMSFLWTSIHTARASQVRYPRSEYVSWEDIGFDPDADYEEDILWCFRECVHPVNMVEREYGLAPGSLKGNMQSLAMQADDDVNVKERNKRSKDGKSFDLLRYYQVWSKNGMGDRLASAKNITLDFSSFGDYCYLVVAPGVPYPLNLPTDQLSLPLNELVVKAAWPIPFWADEVVSNGWPFSRLHFTDKPKSIWPVSMVKPCIGQMRFLNWIMSFLADKTASACTTYVARAKLAGVEIQNQLLGGLAPYTVVEISDMLGKSISDVVSFLQAPSFSIDIWNMAKEVAQQIDKSLGTIDLLYGMTETQMRSAREADVKQSNLNIRPDDMATKVEEWVSTSALKELEAARWLLTGQDIAAVLDPIAGKIWDEQILVRDVDTLVRDFTFRVEAGSARKPNKQARVTQLREIGNVVSGVLQQYAAQGVVEPWNAYVRELAKAMDVDPSQFMVAPPPPPPPPEQQGPSPEQQKVDLERERLEVEKGRINQQLVADQQKMRIESATAGLELQIKHEDLEASQQKMEMDSEAAAEEIKQDREMFGLEKQLLQAKIRAAKSLKKPVVNGKKY